MTRYALVTTRTPEQVAVYLPENYLVVGTTADGRVLVRGEDHAGWTLDAYVIPRLSSGNHTAVEVPSDDPVVTEVIRKTPATVGDVRVEPHGSLVLVRPLTAAAREWLDEHVAEESQWFGGALACEPRYVGELLAALVADGLEMEREL